MYGATTTTPDRIQVRVMFADQVQPQFLTLDYPAGRPVLFGLYADAERVYAELARIVSEDADWDGVRDGCRVTLELRQAACRMVAEGTIVPEDVPHGYGRVDWNGEPLDTWRVD